MGRKCSVENCRSNYTKDTKAVIYGFPLKDDGQLNLWISALPNVILKSEVTRNMGVCEKHWPRTTKMKAVRGRLIPATPPSIFPDCPKTYRRQTASSSSRDIERRGVSAAARTRQDDEVSDFEERDRIPGEFSDFVLCVSEQDFARDFHIITEDSTIRLLHFDPSFKDIEVSIAITADFFVTAYRRHTKVPLRDLLGFQCKLQRWSQLENISARAKNQEVSSSSEIQNLIEKLRDCSFAEECCDSVDFLLEQLALIITSSKGRRYSSKCMMIALSIFLSSRKTYMKLRNYIALPSPKTITQNIGSYSTIGTEEASSRISTLFFSRSNVQSLHCILIFDEMHLKPSLRYRGGHVIGYSHDQPEKLARTALVFMIKMPFQPRPNSFVLRIIPVHTLTAELLFCETLSLLRIVSLAGGKTISIMSDNLSTNRKFHEILRQNYPSQYSYKIPHPVDADQCLYLLFDSVHLIKNIRNNWITEKKQQIAFVPPGSTTQVVAKWEDITELYRSERQNVLKRTNLTATAITPSVFDRQKVSLALQIFNDKTAAALSQDGKNDTACFVYHMNRMWKMLNNKSTTAHIHLNDVDRVPIHDADSKQIRYLKDIRNSFNRMPSGRGPRRHLSLTSETQRSLIQTIGGLIDLTTFLLDSKSVKFILLGVFQSDSLEGEFGAIRGMFGGMYHVALEQVLIAAKSRQLKLFYDLEFEKRTLETHPVHSESCCSTDLTPSEWELIDESVDLIDTVSDNERATVFYIAGFLTLKEDMKLEDAEETDVDYSADSEFTRLLSRGKLKLPTHELFYFLLLSYSFFKNSSILCRRRLVNCLIVIHDNFTSFNCDKSLYNRLANIFYSGMVKTETDVYSVSQGLACRKQMNLKLS